MDIEKEITKAMSDPEIMSKVSSVLSSLGKESGTEGGVPSGGNEIGSVLGALGRVNDDKMRLLMAIKPFLSEKRAPYMDSAVTILRLISAGKIGKDLKLL